MVEDVSEILCRAGLDDYTDNFKQQVNDLVNDFELNNDQLNLSTGIYNWGVAHDSDDARLSQVWSCSDRRQTQALPDNSTAKASEE